MSRPLEELLAGGVIEAAPGLLGRLLISEIGGSRATVAITEVEAYGGGEDPASHAHGGLSGRNRSMFGPPGTLYVYRSYGVHWCMNVVCGPEGVAAAVLLRGALPVEGVETMVRRRGRTDHLADGPGKLSAALGVTGEHDGTSVLEGPLRIGEPVISGETRVTPRVGISRASDLPWRFLLTDVRLVAGGAL